MKIRIETLAKPAKNAPFQVLWSEDKKVTGTLTSEDASLWSSAVTAYLAAQADKTVSTDSDLLRDGVRALLVSRLPQRKGLDRGERLRLAAASAYETARARGVSSVTLLLDRASSDDVRAVLEGLHYADYSFDVYKSAPTKKLDPEVVLRIKEGDKKTTDAMLAETAIVFAHMKNLRDWVNTPGSDLDPATFAGIAVKQAKTHGLTVKVRDEKQLQAEGFLGHWTVGKGSDRPPRMVTLEYAGAPKSQKNAPKFVIVGKGVTFDTGGISLKPSSAMWEMKCDMAGAATTLAALCAIAQLKLRVNVSAVLCLAENRPGNASVLPGDIFKAKNGKTVMVDNTDAEGRLVLSDGLTRASEENPALVLDFATLTGAARVALGPDLPALFARRDETAEALLSAGKAHDDECWRLPLHEAYGEWLKSDIADTNNAHANAFAGASVAALFLDKFVGKNAEGEGTDWAHFDTFAWRPNAKPGRPKGGEALGLRAAWGLLKGRYG